MFQYPSLANPLRQVAVTVLLVSEHAYLPSLIMSGSVSGIRPSRSRDWVNSKANTVSKGDT